MLVVGGKGFMPVEGLASSMQFDITLRRIPLLRGGKPIRRNSQITKDGENMKLALCQMSMSDDVHANRNKTFELLKEAARNHADLALFPEIQLYPFDLCGFV
jgi:hypothetical protein